MPPLAARVSCPPPHMQPTPCTWTLLNFPGWECALGGERRGPGTALPCQPSQPGSPSKLPGRDLPAFYFILFYFIILWLCWVFVSARGPSLVAARGGHSSSRCAGLSLSRPLLLRSTGSRCAGSVIMAHGPSCSAACGIFPVQDSNPCPLHWQADSQPLRHQGSPLPAFDILLHYISSHEPRQQGFSAANLSRK